MDLRGLKLLLFARQGAKTQSSLKNKQTKSQKSFKGAFEIKGPSPDGRENPFVAGFDTKDWNDSGNKLRERKLKK